MHGCFWHGHDCKRGSRIPQTNTTYWTKKIDGNKARDSDTQLALNKLGWRVLVVWECETKSAETLADKLNSFLDSLSEAKKD